MNKNVLFREIMSVTVVLAGGSLVGIMVCRFGLRLVFPYFAEAASATAAHLIGGIPLCLCAWLIIPWSSPDRRVRYAKRS